MSPTQDSPVLLTTITIHKNCEYALLWLISLYWPVHSQTPRKKVLLRAFTLHIGTNFMRIHNPSILLRRRDLREHLDQWSLNLIIYQNHWGCFKKIQMAGPYLQRMVSVDYGMGSGILNKPLSCFYCGLGCKNQSSPTIHVILESPIQFLLYPEQVLCSILLCSIVK